MVDMIGFPEYSFDAAFFKAKRSYLQQIVDSEMIQAEMLCQDLASIKLD